MKICITGVAGFLGSHLAIQLRQDGHDVSGVDNLLGGYSHNVPRSSKFVIADCTDLENMTRLLHGVDVVYHCAAAPHEGLSVFSPGLISHHTYTSTVVVATAAIRNNVRRIVFTSSAARYGHVGQQICFEWQPAIPADPYGVAKVASEEMLRTLSTVHGFEYVIAVPHNIIGPGQKYDDPYRNVASIMINLMLQGRQPFIYGTGEQTRSFSFVGDCVAPLALMATENCHGQIINIGPEGNAITVNELARRIAKLLDFELDPIYIPARPADAPHVHVSAEKAQRLLGYTAKTPLDHGLQQMIQWIQRWGPKPFTYHLPLEIDNEKVPITWKEQLL